MYASLMGHGLDLKHWHVWVGDTIEGKYLTVNVLFVFTLRDYSFLILASVWSGHVMIGLKIRGTSIKNIFPYTHVAQRDRK